MDYQQLEKYKESLTQAIEKNKEQTRLMLASKTSHEKVIEGLETYVQELSVPCLVPIGKLALMRGKLARTNEILAYLGDGFFAKYSASQAISLCGRRIKKANELLGEFERELGLLESQLTIPSDFGAFESEETRGPVEYWEDEKCDDWRAKHRQRVKEYRKKLADLRNAQNKEIQTEKDLFARLDALEHQEELEDALDRLEEDLEDESESEAAAASDRVAFDGMENESDDETMENSSKEGKAEKIVSNGVPSEPRAVNSALSDTDHPIAVTRDSGKRACQQLADTTRDNFQESSKCLDNEPREKKVVFGESQVKYLIEDPTRVGTSLPNDSEDEEQDFIRIHFKHSDNEPEMRMKLDDETIASPRDIYKMLSSPKSILKKSSNWPVQVTACVASDDQIDHTDLDSAPGASAFNALIKDVKEHTRVSTPVAQLIQSNRQKRPVSQFRRERSAMNE